MASKGSWTSSSWDGYSKSRGVDRVTAATVNSVYKSASLKTDLNPLNFKIRESRDSDKYPKSRAIAVGLDVTGSMGGVLAEVVKGLNTLVTETYKRKPVTDPQIAFMGIGDFVYDSSPIQVSQFESDIKIAEALENIYYERRGGSNDSEGYIGAWYYALNHMVTDCFEKRGEKGILFTIGDECPTPSLTREQIKKFIGDDVEVDSYSPEELLDEVSKQWEVYHLIIEQGNYIIHHGNKDKVFKKWSDLLGQNAIPVDDCTKISEIIVSILQANAGESVEKIVASWDGDTSLSVRKAISGLKSTDTSSKLVKF